MYPIRYLEEMVGLLGSTFKGKENGAKASIVKDYCLPKGTTRELRKVCNAINNNLNVNGIVSTSEKIYLCDTYEESKKAIANTYKMAFAYLKKARAMERKLGCNGQVEFTDNDGLKVKIIYGE